MSRFPSEGFSRFATLPPAGRSATVLRAAAELFAASPDHRRDDQAVFEDLFLSVYPEAAAEDRRAVADLLAPAADLPAAVAAAIGNDEIDIAETILSSSPCIGAIDLIRIACHRTQAHRRAIARRPGVASGVVTALVFDGDADVIEILLDNPTADLTPEDLDLIAERAGRHAGVAERLARRRPPVQALPVDDFLGLEADRRWQALAQEGAEAARRSLETRGHHQAPAEAGEIGQGLFEAAVAGDRVGMAEWLSVGLELDRDTARRIVADPGGEALVVAAMALGIDRTLITSIALHQGIPHDRDYWRLKDLDSLAEHGGWRAAQALVDRWRGGEIRAVEALRQVQAAGSRREPQALQRRAAVRDTAARRA
ncbi:DUF2336 domain-containing protein [Prosthecomicrobium hirschii]|uniref:DUF2336 domain-containing protein n=1 Tax=Prosthecodimorpha hirschii TaxID=665126 RepID=UPI00221F3D3D|nr:DUF2336 domain-containing protein [Prosthecomicrobium hirschii]MCW1840650.1 DUF2336 domain-containing protein [Prosthecomicrobium hirschii]